ncbi:MAG: alpha-1,4-glucan--maltose-1-phosphate maltosyltransferase [Chloroflexota bacterium]|nr:MAG: alpha-1,4-glucan--maltose-1-phosphate maltosyltransferase [Chloroflexota bacterium]
MRANAAAPVVIPPRDGLPDDGRRRAIIEAVSPAVDGGRFPVKRVIGDTVVVGADAFADGHDVVSVRLRHRPPGAGDWIEIPMDELGNDQWRAEFRVESLGRHAFTVAAWTDAWATWRRDLRKRIDARQDVAVDLRIGAAMIDGASARARALGAADDGRSLASWATELRAMRPAGDTAGRALDDGLDALMRAYVDRAHETVHEPILEISVEPAMARFSTWYELFPRSTSPDPKVHGTFRDVIARLPYIIDLGFDVLYLPPIHPIGLTFRKGPNNATEARPEDLGVPWAIGSPDGGHQSIHPALGTLDDFRALVSTAEARGVAIALDIAFQASPDHPWVREHPTWFRQRPDGTVQYAENPPKKYQDIYPFDFESDDWPGLWAALEDVFRYWIAQGVHVFRVDNPHTKAFPFWEWAIARIKADHPEVVFLAEAFTRPRVMYRLAKVGFTQSYTYFTWRTRKAELAAYLTELSRPPVSDFFGPNFWPNTPDILHGTLQEGGRSMFEARYVLAATSSSNIGIYGPAYELGENTPREPGSEEYLNSEKYEQRTWDLDGPTTIAPLIRRMNRVRREHAALQVNAGLVIHDIEDDQLIAYSKQTPDGSDRVLAIVSLAPNEIRRGTLRLDLGALGLDPGRPVFVEDLLAGGTETWPAGGIEIEIDPAILPARVLQLRAAT